jgi:hypothetical protein
MGTFLSRDRLGFKAGDLDLFRYAGNSPTTHTDPAGKDWLDSAANFAAGIGDNLTMGATSWIRKQFTIGGVSLDAPIQYESGWYFAGEAVEFSVETAVTLGGAALRKHAARFAGSEARYFLEKNARQAYRRVRGLSASGGVIHHINPIRVGRFPLAFTSAAQGHWNMTWLPSREAHQQVHSWLQKLDMIDYVRAWTSPIRSGGNAIMQHVNGSAGRAHAVGSPALQREMECLYAPDITIKQSIYVNYYLLLEPSDPDH